MRIAIVGAGSLGIVLGAYLSRAGLDVELVNRNRAQVDALRTNGARVTGTVEMTVPVKALTPEEMKGAYDVLFLMTKQLENRATAEFLKPLLAPDGVLCTLQNGLPEDGLREVLGEGRVLGCTVAWGATLEAPGVSRLTSDPGSLSFGLGPADGVWNAQCERVKEILEHMCPVEVVPDLAAARWSKLLINAAFSGVGTVIGGTFGDAAADPVSRRCCLDVMNECIDTAKALGVTIAPVQGKDIVKLFSVKGPVKRFLALRILPLAIRRHAGIEPSMLQDLRRGKPCEIDAINGAVCEAGRRAGVPTPVNDRIVAVIRRIQAGELKPGKENLKYLVR